MSINSEKSGRNLVNYIAVIGMVGAAFLLVVLTIYYGWPEQSNRWYYVITICLFGVAILLNKLNLAVASKFMVTYTPVIFCFMISIVNKKIGPIYINDYYVARVVILAVSIIPFLLFKYDEYLFLAIATVPVFLSLVLFDVIHHRFGVGIFDTGYEDETYFMTNHVMGMCYLAMNGFIYSIKRKNDMYFDELKVSSEKLQLQYRQLQRLNTQIESKNGIISDQNNQLRDFSEKLKDKVLKRTNELTQLNQELAEQNVKLEQFTFITAHNLKSPVTQIKGLLNLINYENGVPTSTKSLLQKINSSCINLEEVINDLNKILNIKSNSHMVEKVNISEIADHIIAGLRNDISKKGITVKRDYHAFIEFNSIKAFVYSILYNLINNAVKYADDKKEKPIIEVSIVYLNNQLEVRIEDNGVGFDQELAGDRVFQLYQRFNTSIHGKGLGLFLVKTQLEMLNGVINVKSRENEGTRFEITIPDAVD